MDYGKQSEFELDQFNLDTDEWQEGAPQPRPHTTEPNPYVPERDSRALGNRIISSTEAIPTPPAQPSAPEFSPADPFMPPNSTDSIPILSPENHPESPAPQSTSPLPPDTTPEQVSETLIDKLGQDGNTEDFYDSFMNARGTV